MSERAPQLDTCRVRQLTPGIIQLAQRIQHSGEAVHSIDVVSYVERLVVQ
jgi:hypothetical protein